MHHLCLQRLLFGLASAPFVFTKVVNVLIKHCRKIGIRIFAFVDDFFGGSHNFHSTDVVANIVALWLIPKRQNGYPLKRTIIWVL